MSSTENLYIFMRNSPDATVRPNYSATPIGSDHAVLYERGRRYHTHYKKKKITVLSRWS